MRTPVRMLNQAGWRNLLLTLKKHIQLGLPFPLVAAFAALFLPIAGLAADAKGLYYWVSHGSPTDPVWMP
jgi:hypothetical protein